MVAEGNGRAEESTAPQREDGEQASTKDSKSASDKHPLEHKWTLWFDNPSGKQKQDSWGSSLRSVYTFDTVEDFWWCVLSLATSCSVNLVGTWHKFTRTSYVQLIQQHQASKLGSIWGRLPPVQEGHRT